MMNEIVLPKYPSDGLPTSPARACAWAVMIIDELGSGFGVHQFRVQNGDHTGSTCRFYRGRGRLREAGHRSAASGRCTERRISVRLRAGVAGERARSWRG